VDFDTLKSETLEIKKKELNSMEKQAKKKSTYRDGDLILEYAVKKPGVYRLQKVVDDSKLEVQRRMSDTIVVTCPKAVIKPSALDRCVGDLSDLTIDVEGTPPMKIVYSRIINKEDQSVHTFQSIQPENLVSPLLGSGATGALVVQGEHDVSWGRSHSINVRLNESMTPGGKWLYSIEEVHDAIGNVANFSSRGTDGEHVYPKGSFLERAFTVHERPQARLHGCDTQTPLKVPISGTARLPVQFGPGGDSQDMGYAIKWKFSPLDTLTASGDHGDNVIIEDFVVKGPRQQPLITRPGLYTLTGVSSKFCVGEINEPASCLLLNPPEPHLTLASEDIYDNCAGNSIGLLVDLDLIGTPPFLVRYEVIKNNRGNPAPFHVKIDGLRHQLELKPKEAGHFTYRFTSISDSVYPGRSLDSKILKLEQDVKPPASARLIKPVDEIVACIETPIRADVSLQGESPFTLEYELIHDGKRNKQKVKDIKGSSYTISTDPLNQGGDYTLALVSVQDKTGCKIYLKDEIHIVVRRQRPKASFGLLEGKRNVMAIEGRQIALPLRLEGEGPWHVSYTNIDEPDPKIIRVDMKRTNDFIKVKQSGIYRIVDVSDSHCPGVVDLSGETFEVQWFSRPDIKVADKAGLVTDGKRQLKREVCEGDIDAVEIILKGEPQIRFLSFA
jgi:nucleoporin POM152